LRRYRIAAGLTQEQLAERARMSLAAVGKLERGARSRPYQATIALLAGALSLSGDDRIELERAAGRGAYAASDPEQESEQAIKLPIRFSSFVGRERDLEKIGEMLAARRLVTLVGAGGVGKTRLAIHAAEDFIAKNPTGEHFDGVWFVDLAPIADGAMVVMALASSIGAGACRTIDALVSYLRSQTFLLILDNCEHVLDAIAPAAMALVAGCPGARILATSRQALSVEGERIYRVPPLLEFDAIRLFADRAEATDSRFVLTDSVLPAVTDICRRVDGIALAIELAAARTNAFSPASIAEQIGEQLSLLAGAGTSDRRHRTMHSLFDWSYELLDDRERELFRRSSIFAGGFTLDLLRALYSERYAQGDIPRVLASLVDKSFVQCDILVGPRYRLLEPARQYAREKLIESGEYGRAARSHALALLTFAEAFDSRMELIPDRVWDESIERERDNFRSAFEWTLGSRGDASLGQRLAASRSATWSGYGSGEVRDWIRVALDTVGDSTARAVVAKLAISAARAAVIFGPSWNAENPPEVRVDTCRRALSLQRPDDPRSVAAAQYWLGVALRDCGRYDEADAALRETRTIAHSVGAQTEYNAATTSLAAVRYGVGDLSEAHALILEALQRSEDAGSDRIAADVRATLAEIQLASGSPEEALQSNETTTRFFRSHSNLIGLPLTLCNSATCLIVLERYREARDHAAEALRRSVSIGSVHCAFWAMQHLAAATILENTARSGDEMLREAASLVGFVDEVTTRMEIPRYGAEQQEYDKMLAVLREMFGEDELARLMTAGKAWSEEKAVAVALTPTRAPGG
jgi:predicted ATPase/DNA-binding XRE family transcriptional regulator